MFKSGMALLPQLVAQLQQAIQQGMLPIVNMTSPPSRLQGVQQQSVQPGALVQWPCTTAPDLSLPEDLNQASGSSDTNVSTCRLCRIVFELHVVRLEQSRSYTVLIYYNNNYSNEVGGSKIISRQGHYDNDFSCRIVLTHIK